ncbi:MAG: KOW domain-containing RNA-binding protein [bacterium]|nr:KOW domain-containing RNA-binding protein [bacterium]MCM1374610.1 KOW domain-containing RNA-binding protein [Muribaculum sp.]
MTGHFARASAGHDSGILYVIVREEGAYVYLSDGRLRTVQHPKKKNRRHIQIIGSTVETELLNRLLQQGKIYDHEIKYAIKQYMAEHSRQL